MYKTDTAGKAGKGKIMSEFKPITTQEEFDTAISARLERERKTAAKKYEGYLSPEDAAKKYEGYLSPEDVAKKDAAIQEYETAAVKTRIANQVGIPFELVDKLSGTTEAEITEDAKRLATFLGGDNQPLFNDSGTQAGKNNDAAYKKLASALTKGD